MINMIQGLDSRFAVSFWVLVEKPCSNHLCGLLLHIDAENNYATPSLFLTDTRKAVNHSNDFHSFLFCITYRIHFCLICSHPGAWRHWPLISVPFTF